ncbi:hypothetical protein BDZ91DRAFT_851784 [Kalaharituber pfeilii]|nr:hypothetical protein BDZ91DRAFT_851784 [Kalaharituber pfeilii]
MARKKILLLGATSPSGIAVIRHALSLSEPPQILVYARNPSKLPQDLLINPSVTVLPGGSLTDVGSLRSAVAERPDAIVSLLGPPTASSETLEWFNPFSATGRGTPFVDAYRVIVDAMKEYGVRRILVMGTVSIVDPNDKRTFMADFLAGVVWALVNKAWKNVVAVGKFFENIPPEEGIEWSVFRIGRVLDGDFQGVTDGYIGDGKGTLHIRRSELSKWLVEHALTDTPVWTGKQPAVSSTV